MDYDADVMVLGGSIAGLMAARAIASRGFSVEVLEEDLEVGIPEHCGGLVSLRGLVALGVAPQKSFVLNEVRKAVFHSPGGKRIEFDSTKQNVIVLNRKEFDKYVAKLALRDAATMSLGIRVQGVREVEDAVEVDTNRGRKTCRYAVDAMGVHSLLNRRRSGILQAAQYEVRGSWVEDGAVEIFLDQNRSPGFFTWIIPLGKGMAKVGVAGDGINSYQMLDEFISSKGSTIVKKVAAPIIVGGPIDSFVNGRLVVAGDAAGQAKPTTSGGIYTGGLAGYLAGEAIADSLSEGSPRLHSYESRWRSRFGREFKIQLEARRLLQYLTNKQLDGLFKVIAASDIPKSIPIEGDFDFHSVALAKALGVRGVVKVLGSLAMAKLSELFAGRDDRKSLQLV